MRVLCVQDVKNEDVLKIIFKLGANLNAAIRNILKTKKIRFNIEFSKLYMAFQNASFFNAEYT